MASHPIRLISCFLSLAALLLIPGLALTAPCGPICLATNGNTTIEVDTVDDEDGLEDLRVDGVDHMFESFSYLRFGAAGSTLGPEDSLVQQLTTLNTADATSDVITLRYQDDPTMPTLIADLVYTVLGGTAGSGMSTVQTMVTLTNASTGPLDIVWFDNPDMDLNGSQASDQTGVFTAPGTVTQTNGITTATYTSSLAPTAWHLASPSTVQGPIDNDDGTVTNLPNATSPFGPADVGFAFQYNFSNLGTGNSVSYTTTLGLAPVPVPSAMLLFGTGLAALAGWRKWKTNTA